MACVAGKNFKRHNFFDSMKLVENLYFIHEQIIANNELIVTV